MQAKISLRDTLTRKVRPLESSDGNSFRFYCCGPTVYGPAHIGNFRTFVIQDVFRRLLEVTGMTPKHVRNITDVDDKTITRSQEEGVSLKDFTTQWTDVFHQDCKRLNLLPPHEEAKATEFIDEQIALIETLISKEAAYVAEDGSVYFRIKSFKDYGKLAHLNPEDLKTQTTNSAGNTNHADEYDRESISDFALWKAHKKEDGPNAWDSPWGKGRPGWHIECSAMSMKHLGETFDLHAGGIDLCFPHHENEIAQSESATGKPFCHHWFHNAHLMVEGEKMSKSLGNLYTIEDLIEKGFSPASIRYLLISGIYHQPLNFTFDGLHAADSALGKIEKCILHLLREARLEKSDWANFAEGKHSADWGRFSPVLESLCDDLNVPEALGRLFTEIKKLEQESHTQESAKEALKALGNVIYVLGLQLFSKKEATVPDSVKTLAEERWHAKKDKDFSKADTLRDEIHALGWEVMDKPEGYEIIPRS